MKEFNKTKRDSTKWKKRDKLKINTLDSKLTNNKIRWMFWTWKWNNEEVDVKKNVTQREERRNMSINWEVLVGRQTDRPGYQTSHIKKEWKHSYKNIKINYTTTNFIICNRHTYNLLSPSHSCTSTQQTQKMTQSGKWRSHKLGFISILLAFSLCFNCFLPHRCGTITFHMWSWNLPRVLWWFGGGPTNAVFQKTTRRKYFVYISVSQT